MVTALAADAEGVFPAAMTAARRRTRSAGRLHQGNTSNGMRVKVSLRSNNPKSRMSQLGHSRRFKREVAMTASPQNVLQNCFHDQNEQY